MSAEPQSTANHLKFISLKPESFAAFNRKMDMLFVLQDKDNPDTKAVMVTGDQGLGKTSLMASIIYGLSGMKPENATNSIDKDEKLELVFKNDPDSTYITRATKTGFTLTKVDDKTQTSSKINAPKDALRRIVGPLGISPMDLKNKTGAQQLKWVRDLANISEAAKKLEADTKEKRKTAFKERTVINRTLKQVKDQLLNQTNYFKFEEKQLLPQESYTKHLDYYSQNIEVRAREVMAASEETNKLNNEYQIHHNNLNGVSGYAAQKQRNDDRIKSLQQQIAEIDAANKEIDEKSEQSRKFVEENKDIESRLKAVTERVQKLGEHKANKLNFDRIRAAYQDYLSNEESLIIVQKTMDEYDQKLKEFIAAITPEIEGLEVCVPSEVDVESEEQVYRENNPELTESEVKEYVLGLEDEKREGIFFNGHAVAELSESELWDLAIQFWGGQGVKVIFIENVTSLGSGAVDRINKFIESGGQAFCTAMDRDVKTQAKITFLNKI